MAEAVDIHNLLNAFKLLGGDRNGKIEYSKVASLLQHKMGITKEEVADLLKSKTCRSGDVLDYVKLCTSILHAKAMFDHIAECDKKLVTNKKINSRTFTRKKGSGRPSSGSRVLEQDNLQNSHNASLKGCFYDTDVTFGLSGHRYLLELTENSPVEIVAQAIDKKGCLSPSPAIEILLFQENEEPNKKLVTFSSFADTEGYCSIKVNLKRGKYLLVPVTLKWKADEKVIGLPEMEPMVEVNDDGETVLTPACKNALKAVFDCIDLDRNGLVCQSEFDLFIQHICGETAAEEWTTVEDNFDTVKGELSFDGFLALYHMAIVTDPRDVVYMFAKMGLTSFSSLEKALPYLLTVTAKATTPVLKPLPVCAFDPLMEEVFRKTAVEQGHCNKIRNMNDLLLYTHKLPHRVTIVVVNQSHSTVKVRLDCSKSENSISHQSSLNHTVEVQPRTSMVGHHLFPDDHLESWSVQCVETFVE